VAGELERLEELLSNGRRVMQEGWR
jgi:hypothetical protein